MQVSELLIDFQEKFKLEAKKEFRRVMLSEVTPSYITVMGFMFNISNLGSWTLFLEQIKDEQNFLFFKDDICDELEVTVFECEPYLQDRALSAIVAELKPFDKGGMAIVDYSHKLQGTDLLELLNLTNMVSKVLISSHHPSIERSFVQVKPQLQNLNIRKL